MDRLFIKPEYLQILNDIFDYYCPNAEIWAYGSRITNRAHSGSDLDLVVKDFHNDNLNVYELKEILTETNIPFLIDIHEFDNLPQSFQEEIKKDYVIIYPCQQ